MPEEERKRKIESYGNAYTQIVDALQQYPREMWQFKATPDRWTIHEIIIHLADSEANSYIRCRRFIAEPGLPVMAYDESAWSELLHYHDQSTDDALELFRLLRMGSYKLIKSLPSSTWTNTVFHPENGIMTMHDWLQVYDDHVPHHLKQMQANYEAWISQNR